MIIVRKNTLSFNNTSYKCSVGKNGISNKKNEGDGCTPFGQYSLGNVYYRDDKVTLPKIDLHKIVIKKKFGWCDDLNSDDYNKCISFPFNYSAENLYRTDNIYDIICLINYNTNPIIKGKGSAIFLHVAHDDYSATEGCIALKKDDLIKLLSQINITTKINIIS